MTRMVSLTEQARGSLFKLISRRPELAKLAMDGLLAAMRHELMTHDGEVETTTATIRSESRLGDRVIVTTSRPDVCERARDDVPEAIDVMEAVVRTGADGSPIEVVTVRLPGNEPEQLAYRALVALCPGQEEVMRALASYGSEHVRLPLMDVGRGLMQATVPVAGVETLVVLRAIAMTRFVVASRAKESDVVPVAWIDEARERWSDLWKVLAEIECGWLIGLGTGPYAKEWAEREGL